VMQCEVCRTAVEMRVPHYVTQCGHAYHSACLGNEWTLPGCITCRSSVSTRGQYNVDRGTDAAVARYLQGVTKHVSRQPHPPPSKTYFSYNQSPAWKLVHRMVAMKEPRPTVQDVMSSGATYDMMREAGVTLESMTSTGLSEEQLIQVGYGYEHVSAGDTLPGGTNMLLRQHTVDATASTPNALLTDGLSF
jgi:hypothetical protein